jgi:hypothetical protein
MPPRTTTYLRSETIMTQQPITTVLGLARLNDGEVVEDARGYLWEKRAYPNQDRFYPVHRWGAFRTPAEMRERFPITVVPAFAA